MSEQYSHDVSLRDTTTGVDVDISVTMLLPDGIVYDDGIYAIPFETFVEGLAEQLLEQVWDNRPIDQQLEV